MSTTFREKFENHVNTRFQNRIDNLKQKKFIHKPKNKILVECQSDISFRVNDEDTGTRYYVMEDNKNNFAISMTSLISRYTENAALDNWKKRVGQVESTRIAHLAAENGKIHHSLCDNYLNNRFEVVVSALKGLDLSYLEQFEKVIPELQKIDNILSVEQALFSKKYLVAGTADVIGEYETIPSIIDHKTSKKEKPKKYIHNYFLQETGYSMILEEMTGIDIKQIVTIVSVFEENMQSQSSVQVFVEKTDNYKDEVLDLFKKWKNKN